MTVAMNHLLKSGEFKESKFMQYLVNKSYCNYFEKPLITEAQPAESIKSLWHRPQLVYSREMVTPFFCVRYLVVAVVVVVLVIAVVVK
jgi:hypothetical protein